MTTGHFIVSKFHTWNGLRKTSGIPLANMMSHMYKMYSDEKVDPSPWIPWSNPFWR